jgi:hypothetical protein
MEIVILVVNLLLLVGGIAGIVFAVLALWRSSLALQSMAASLREIADRQRRE